MKVKDKKATKPLEERQEIIKAEANDIRAKYPEIAKMTVAEVVDTDEFIEQFKKAYKRYKIINFYAFQSLKNIKAFEPENFKKKYIDCIDKASNLPYPMQAIVISIGHDAYRNTVIEMMKQYDKQRTNK